MMYSIDAHKIDRTMHSMHHAIGSTRASTSQHHTRARAHPLLTPSPPCVIIGAEAGLGAGGVAATSPLEAAAGVQEVVCDMCDACAIVDF